LNTDVIHLGNDTILSRVGFPFMVLFNVALGILHYDLAKVPWFLEVTIPICILVSIKAIYEILYIKNHGRLRVVFSENGLEYKTKRSQLAQNISWQDIACIRLTSSAVEIILKSQNVDPIKILFRTISINQELTTKFKEYVSKRDIELVEQV